MATPRKQRWYEDSWIEDLLKWRKRIRPYFRERPFSRIGMPAVVILLLPIWLTSVKGCYSSYEPVMEDVGDGVEDFFNDLGIYY